MNKNISPNNRTRYAAKFVRRAFTQQSNARARDPGAPGISSSENGWKLRTLRIKSPTSGKVRARYENRGIAKTRDTTHAHSTENHDAGKRQDTREKNSGTEGFTLLELLVSLSVIGIISAIAIPEYRAYQRRAFDIRALGDLRTVALAEEAYFMSAEKYISCLNTACETLPGVSRLSQGVALTVTAAADTFTADATHPKGTGKHYRWDSENGGLQ